MSRTEKIICDRCGADMEPGKARTYFKTKTSKDKVRLTGLISHICRLHDGDITNARELNKRLMDDVDLCDRCTSSLIRWFFMEEEQS